MGHNGCRAGFGKILDQVVLVQLQVAIVLVPWCLIARIPRYELGVQFQESTRAPKNYRKDSNRREMC